MENEIVKKTQQIEIQFDGINRKIINQILKDIEKASKIKTGFSDMCKHRISLGYSQIPIDTFHAICERFNVKPEYRSGSQSWTVFICIDKNDTVLNEIFVNLSSETMALEYSYRKTEAIK